MSISLVSAENEVARQVEELNRQLNEIKDQLNRPDFNELKRKDPWEIQIRQLRRFITDRQGGQNVTKAWLKMYEILDKTPVGDRLRSLIKNTVVKCFFNAELPGGFIYAMNHFLKTHGLQFEWVISSYFPQNTSGKDYLKDEFELIRKYPSNSLVGKLSTNKGTFWCDGDLTNAKMPAILAQLAKAKLGSIFIYTADGGFDVSGQENYQEQVSLPLIRGEIECGLRSLSEGGIFVLKIFTFFTPQMWTLLVYLMRRFNYFDIFKPKTSGVMNSESYFIGVGFRGVSGDDLNILMKDPRDQSTRYANPNAEETEFLLNKLRTLVGTQISNINEFLSEGSIELDVNINISTLNPSDKL